MIGIYVHIPFCAHICPYCDFRKTSLFTPKDIKSYFSSLLDQAKSALSWIPASTKDCTLYFGGGTPGLFPASYYAPLVELIRERFFIKEFSIETNPLTNQKNYLKSWKELGVNRVTIGAQSLNNNVLNFLGRKHRFEDIMTTLEWANSFDFNSIQVDLIYGIALDKEYSMTQEIQMVSKAGATGISAYGLTLENRTSFGQSKNSSVVDRLLPEEGFEKEYKAVYEACQNAGWTQWEVSNFGKDMCLHNQQYWDGEWYLGFGTGAHGLVPLGGPWGSRYCVGEEPKQRSPGDDILVYRDDVMAQPHWSILWDPPRSHLQMVEERVMTGLRTRDGLPKPWILENCEEGILDSLFSDPKISRAIAEGKIIFDEQGIRLNWQEKLRADFWAVEIVFLIEKKLLKTN